MKIINRLNSVTMKRMTFLVCLAAALFTGCVSDPMDLEYPDCPTYRDVILSAGQSETRAYVGEQTATADNPNGSYSLVWDEGDAIGVFVSGATSEINTQCVSTSGKGASKASFKARFASAASNSRHTYSAYSPYNANAGVDPTALTGTLSATQIQTDTQGTHIGDYMLEIAAPVEGPDNSGTDVDLHFENQFSILNFKIKYRALGVNDETVNFKGVKVSNVRVYAAAEDATSMPLYSSTYNLAGSYTFNLNTQTTTMKTGSYSWIIDCVVRGDNEVKGSTNDQALDVWMVVNPVNLNGVKLVAEIITDMGTFHTTRTIKSNNGQLQPNMVYVLPATIRSPKVTPKIYPLWTEGSTFFGSNCEHIYLGTTPTSEMAGATELKPANCFMVQPNKWYKFKANVRGRGQAGVEAMGITSDDLVGDYAITADGTLTPTLTDEYCYFKTTTTGNGVLSLYFGGTVLWSWHVWSMEDTPTSVQVAEDVHMLDRNLGALKVTTAESTLALDLYALYYCWGFNVPFPGPAKVTAINGVGQGVYSGKNLNNIYYYNGTTEATLTETRLVIPSATLATSVMQPKAPAYLMANDEKNVDTDPYLHMWGLQGTTDTNDYEKTAFDPCPYGYRVASYYDYLPIRNISRRQLGAGVELTILADSYFIPQGIVGCELASDGNTDAWYLQLSGFNYMWTATPAWPAEATNEPAPGSSIDMPKETDPTNGRAMSRLLWPSNQKTTNYAMRRYQGAPVRCVKYDAEN